MAKDVQTAADRNTLRSAMRQTTGMYKDKAALLAETDALPEGEVFGCIDEGYSYEVAASGATDHDETTAGGDKLYRLYPEAVAFDQVAPAATPITGTPTGTGGNVNGTVYYSVSFVTADGGFTQASVRSSAVSATNETVDLTNIPVSPDRRVVARKIYRTPDGVSDVVLGQLLTTINDNTTTTYTDNTADGSLGALAPWVNTTGVNFTDGAETVMAIGSHATKLGEDTFGVSAGGYASTAVGWGVLQNLTSGVRNTGVGHSALNSVTTGNANIGIGVHAGESTTTGTGNISIGYGAGSSNIAQDGNTYIGDRCGDSDVTGQLNTYVGASAAQSRTAGNNNVGIGYQALLAGTGSNNIGIGHQVGRVLTTGFMNTIVGYQAGYDLTTGSSNVLIGRNAGENISTGGSNICIGRQAGNYLTTESNSFFVDNQDRGNITDAKAESILYGVMAAAPASQTLAINAVVTMDYGTILGAAAPSSASDTGTAGEIRVDADYIYVCTATDTWKRVAIATW